MPSITFSGGMTQGATDSGYGSGLSGVFKVPDGVFSLTMDVAGGAGATTNTRNTGGKGARVQATLAVVQIGRAHV